MFDLQAAGYSTSIKFKLTDRQFNNLFNGSDQVIANDMRIFQKLERCGVIELDSRTGKTLRGWHTSFARVQSQFNKHFYFVHSDWVVYVGHVWLSDCYTPFVGFGRGRTPKEALTNYQKLITSSLLPIL